MVMCAGLRLQLLIWDNALSTKHTSNSMDPIFAELVSIDVDMDIEGYRIDVDRDLEDHFEPNNNCSPCLDIARYTRMQNDR